MRPLRAKCISAQVAVGGPCRLVLTLYDPLARGPDLVVIAAFRFPFTDTPLPLAEWPFPFVLMRNLLSGGLTVDNKCVLLKKYTPQLGLQAAAQPVRVSACLLVDAAGEEPPSTNEDSARSRRRTRHWRERCRADQFSVLPNRPIGVRSEAPLPPRSCRAARHSAPCERRRGDGV